VVFLDAMTFLISTWAEDLYRKKMQSILGEKELSRSGRTEFASVRVATRFGRKTTRMTITVTIEFHFHFHFTSLGKECVPNALIADVMRHVRTVIRSLMTPEGCIVAMDDATVVWKPKGSRQKRTRIEDRASVLLGLIGPKGVVDRIVAGDVGGGVSIISLISMEVIDRFVVSKSKIRSLCVSSVSGESILVGCDDGSVHLIGQNVPDRVVNLFELDGPASALRIVGQDLHIQQGWERKIVDWRGKESLAVA